MSKPQILTSSMGSPTGCIDGSGNVISVNDNGPAGRWCRNYIAGSGAAVAPDGGTSPQKIVAKMTTKYRLFLGSPKADIKTNLVYVATSAVGFLVGYKITKKKEKKEIGAAIGVGLGLATGLVINAITKKL